MTIFRFVLYGLLVVSLTACPFLDLPAPLAPLAQPKTQKTSYKTEICRQKNRAAIYNAEGLLISTGSSEWDMQYVYDANGFLIKESNQHYTVTYEYDAAGLLKTATYTNFDKQFFPDRLKDVYAYVGGRLQEERLTFVNNQEYKIAETDVQGRVVKAYTYGIDLSNNKVNLNGYSNRSYDAANNLIRIENKNQDGSIGGIIAYEYDDHPVPPVYIPKGHQFKYQDSHNITKISGVSYSNKEVVGEDLKIQSFTYNSAGYPIKLDWKSTYTSSVFPLREYSGTLTYEYEGCQ